MNKFAALFTILFFAFTAIGCDPPVEPDAENPSQMAARGKFTRAVSLFNKATFSEEPEKFIEVFTIIRESLSYDSEYFRSNAFYAILLLEMSKHTAIIGENLPGVNLSPATAKIYAEKAVKAAPKFSEGWAALAMVNVQLADFSGAKSALSKAKSIDKLLVSTILAEADYLFGQPANDPKTRGKNLSQAMQMYITCADAEPMCGLYYMRQLDILELVGDVSGIVAILGEIKMTGNEISPARSIRYGKLGIK
jgi:hypothetical protein